MTGSDLYTKVTREMPKYGFEEMVWLKQRSEVHRGERHKMLISGTSKVEKMEERLCRMEKGKV